jgi:DNA primase
MEIQDIKSHLLVLEVLQHYGLKPDKNNRIRCPFHDDHSPSMQIYPQTNTFCCFSSNCSAGTGDVIEFIELMEKCTRYEALMKATLLAQGSQPLPPKPSTPETPTSIEDLTREAILTKVFHYYRKGLPLTKKAVEYLKSRCLDYTTLEVAYNSGGLHVESKNHHLVESMVGVGLLKSRPANGYSVWAKDCILFPLKGADNKIISLYGRSIRNNEESRHFYLPSRTGLYPGYPKHNTTKLILTESIIDAASLLQQPSITEQYAVLALYGTNGLTDEHQQAILKVKDLQEIIMMLNADEAGEAATSKHAQTLHALLPDMQITRVQLPTGEDVNSVLQSHDDPNVLVDLVQNRTDFIFSTERKKSSTEITDQPAQTFPTPSLQLNSKLNVTNPELLIYDNCELYVEILGGIKITGLDRMKVTLKVQHKEKVSHPQWYSLDLYNQMQREQTINNVAETLELSTQGTTTTFINLITELEHHRLKRIEALQPREKPVHELSAAQRQTAISELKKPKLLQRTGQLLRECGIVGEENNSLIAYLIYTVRKQPVPLHVMFLGSSGSGKTYLQERISELIPAEDKIEITQITDNALYYFKQEELKHKLLLIEDLDGAMTVFYPLRELQTKRRISKTVTMKDSKGNLKTITLTVEGPVCVSGCTTKEKIYEDNANRCILLYTDQGKDQDKRINEYQVSLAAGEINKERESRYRELFNNMQRVLRPINIINPYAKWIALPEQVFKPRRTMTLLLGFIEAVTFYHQYQREVKKDGTGQLYIETSADDIEAAFSLLKDVLFSKSDELSKATRIFLEHLKIWLKQENKEAFAAKEIRKLLRLAPATLKRYLWELERYGYIKTKGNRYVKYEYSINDYQEYSSLKSSIDKHLQDVLESIRQIKQ